jgi:hypothetical protein
MSNGNVIIELLVPPGGRVFWSAPGPTAEIVCPVAGSCSQIRCASEFDESDHVGQFRLVRGPKNVVTIDILGIFRSGSKWRMKDGSHHIVGDASLWRDDELIGVNYAPHP